MAVYLSCSCSWKTFRFVWSRMILALMKPPRSSFFARNCDMISDSGMSTWSDDFRAVCALLSRCAAMELRSRLRRGRSLGGLQETMRPNCFNSSFSDIIGAAPCSSYWRDSPCKHLIRFRPSAMTQTGALCSIWLLFVLREFGVCSWPTSIRDARRIYMSAESSPTNPAMKGHTVSPEHLPSPETLS
jgi:hypothetical protein